MAAETPDTAAARHRLAAEQGRLLNALAGAAPPPEGFDAARVVAAAASLRNKRRRGVARAWPALAEWLGPRFVECFDAYVASSPHPPDGGPAADALAFAEHLARGGLLPAAARVPLLLARCRRGLPFRAALLRRPLRLLLAVRLPRLGVRHVVLPPRR